LIHQFCKNSNKKDFAGSKTRGHNGHNQSHQHEKGNPNQFSYEIKSHLHRLNVKLSTGGFNYGGIRINNKNKKTRRLVLSFCMYAHTASTRHHGSADADADEPGGGR
jgi:hypothetical protein